MSKELISAGAQFIVKPVGVGLLIPMTDRAVKGNPKAAALGVLGAAVMVGSYLLDKLGAKERNLRAFANLGVTMVATGLMMAGDAMMKMGSAGKKGNLNACGGWLVAAGTLLMAGQLAHNLHRAGGDGIQRIVEGTGKVVVQDFGALVAVGTAFAAGKAIAHGAPAGGTLDAVTAGATTAASAHLFNKENAVEGWGQGIYPAVVTGLAVLGGVGGAFLERAENYANPANYPNVNPEVPATYANSFKVPHLHSVGEGCTVPAFLLAAIGGVGLAGKRLYDSYSEAADRNTYALDDNPHRGTASQTRV